MLRQSLSRRLRVYVRRFPSFSMMGSLRQNNADQHGPFGENESQPEECHFEDDLTPCSDCGIDEEDTISASSVGLGKDEGGMERKWVPESSSFSLDAELLGQGWVPETIALEADAVGPASSNDMPTSTPTPSSAPPVDHLHSISIVDRRKRKPSVDTVDKSTKKKKTGQQTKNSKKWFASGKLKRKKTRQEDFKRQEMVSVDPPSAVDPLPPYTNHSNPGRPRNAVSQKYGNPSVLKLDDPEIDEEMADLRNYSTQPGWICDAKKGKSHETKVPTLEEMKARGFQVISFPPTERLVALDKEENIMVALTGLPNDPSFLSSVRNCEKAMKKAGDVSGVAPTPGSRGNIAVLTAGCTHYMGTTKPSNRSQRTASNREAIRLLRNNADINRLAAHQSALLGFYAPKEALYYDITLDKLYQHDRTLRRPFLKSIYPSVAFNVDPNTVTLDHTDAGNYPTNLCAITAFGNYDHKRGGHIILYDLRLIIEFPVGYTFLIPSGAMRHGNTAISEGETRYSMVQYCPGGLLRWVEHGFQNEASYERSGGKQLSSERRWEQVLGKLSRLSDLVKDHQLYRRGC